METRSVLSETRSFASAVQGFESTTNNEETNDDEKPKKEQVKEQMSIGSVGMKMYSVYFRAGGSWISLIFLIFMNLLCTLLYVGADVWLSIWSSKEEERELNRLEFATKEELVSPVIAGTVNITYHQEQQDYYDHYFNLD